MLRGRFAPTPSGEMHIGNARTALLAWLQMRSAEGEFILRMEDIDKPRSRPVLARQIIEDLRWLGLDWDEGPDISGSYGPYTQSERLDLYEKAAARLQADGLLYPCYCSRAELNAIARAPHGLASEGPAYPGICRGLTNDERAAKAASKQPSLRFIVPDGLLSYEDQAMGRQTVSARSGGDFIIKRADGIFSYQLAVVIDDAAMQITDVLRGSDLLDSTPRQLLLYEALGYQPPRFTHVPLLVEPDGSRLAKRSGALSLRALREAGVPPERIIGALASISGLHDRVESIHASELIRGFSVSRIPDKPVTVDAGWLGKLQRR